MMATWWCAAANAANRFTDATAIRTAISPCGKNPPANSAPNANHLWSMGQKALPNAATRSALIQNRPLPLPKYPPNKNKKHPDLVGMFFIVSSARIERASPASEARVLSIQRQGQLLLLP